MTKKVKTAKNIFEKKALVAGTPNAITIFTSGEAKTNIYNRLNIHTTSTKLLAPCYDFDKWKSENRYLQLA